MILHFAAYTDVSQAENQRDDKNGACWQINVEGTRNLVKLAKEVNAHFIHISTDYVFPGSEEDPGPHKESDIPEVNSSEINFGMDLLKRRQKEWLIVFWVGKELF